MATIHRRNRVLEGKTFYAGRKDFSEGDRVYLVQHGSVEIVRNDSVVAVLDIVVRNIRKILSD
ncbi:MAG: hypothetical protein M0006_17065 [Magnetospirillum sp.]|nr:hypothetical protein [Magnetospirillum sp.]